MEADVHSTNNERIPLYKQHSLNTYAEKPQILSADPNTNDATARAQPTANDGAATPAEDVLGTFSGAGASCATAAPARARIVAATMKTPLLEIAIALLKCD
ncbi:hypothetical protein SASPL_116880 [Salvia splendens]|uniref:Uncharacterized protein n=1 Tax=Salvia splendens TaxID=180675 RepID=A0A8X8XUQ2_SALSN|nr:hypothetical protein SASPL_116880 [Salvia splendens]